jgi:hypothetical protein
MHASVHARCVPCPAWGLPPLAAPPHAPPSEPGAFPPAAQQAAQLELIMPMIMLSSQAMDTAQDGSGGKQAGSLLLRLASVRYAPTPRFILLGWLSALKASEMPRMPSGGACGVGRVAWRRIWWRWQGGPADGLTGGRRRRWPTAPRLAGLGRERKPARHISLCLPVFGQEPISGANGADRPGGPPQGH